MKKSRELQLIQRDFLVGNALMIIEGLKRTPKSFSECFDTGKKTQDPYGNDRVNDRWVSLLMTNRVPSSKTINQIIDGVPELKEYYNHVLWDAINPSSLGRFQILKLLCRLPNKIRKHLKGIKNEAIRKRDFTFSFPSTKRLFYIGANLDLDSFAALILIMRYENLEYRQGDISINYLYEELAYSASVVCMSLPPFNIVKRDIYNFICKNFSSFSGSKNAREVSIWKLEIPLKKFNQWHFQFQIGGNRVIDYLSPREVTLIEIYTYVLERTRKEESILIRLIPKI